MSAPCAEVGDIRLQHIAKGFRLFCLGKVHFLLHPWAGRWETPGETLGTHDDDDDDDGAIQEGAKRRYINGSLCVWRSPERVPLQHSNPDQGRKRRRTPEEGFVEGQSSSSPSSSQPHAKEAILNAAYFYSF